MIYVQRLKLLRSSYRLKVSRSNRTVHNKLAAIAASFLFPDSSVVRLQYPLACRKLQLNLTTIDVMAAVLLLYVTPVALRLNHSFVMLTVPTHVVTPRHLGVA